MMDSEHNQQKIGQLVAMVHETLKRVLQKGYHGEVSFKTSIHDGSIQEIHKQEIEKHR